MANGLRSLDQLGVGDAVRALSATMLSSGDGLHTSKGRRLMRPANPEFVRSHGLSMIVLLHPELQRALFDVLPASCLRTGAEVIKVLNRPGGGVLVDYRTREGDHTVQADVVVAATG
jgi:2-polyprenyl-6-methoxyphenol hydroxylase-like FAD-dependent oxidoreductase